MQLKLIQRGTIHLSNTEFTKTATITSVDTAKTELRHLGQRATVAAGNDSDLITIELTNATTITATRITQSLDAYVSWELTEYV